MTRPDPLPATRRAVATGLGALLLVASCNSGDDTTDAVATGGERAVTSPPGSDLVAPSETGESDPPPSSVPSSGQAGTLADGEPGHTCWSSTPDGGDGGDGVEFRHAAADFGLVEPLTGMHPHAVAAGDVDDDGWTDLFVGSFADRPPENYAVRGASGPSPDRILLGGPEGFTVDETFEGEYARTSGAVFADLDDDGDLDLVAARNVKGADEISTRPTTLFENTGDGWTVRGTVGTDVRGRAVAAVDLDGDGVLDLILAGDRYGDGSTHVYRGDGTFGFEDMSDAWGIPNDFTGLAFATLDLDGDGWIDIAMNGDPRVLLGGPDGVSVVDVPQLRWEVYGDEDDPAGMAVGDLNGDDRPDLVLGHHFNSTVDAGARVPVRVLLNRSGDGSVAFDDVTDASNSPALWTKSPHVSVVDVDNDGRNDIVTSAATDDDLPYVLRNVGSADGVPRFEPAGEPGTGDYFVTGATTDVDRDGRVDVLLVAWEPERASVLAGNVSAGGSWLEVATQDTPIGDPVVVVDPASGATIARARTEATTGYAAGAPGVVHLGLGDVSTEVAVRQRIDGAVVESTVAPNARVDAVGCPG